EGDGIAGLDLDRLTGLRVLPGAGPTVALHEGAEAHQRHAVLAVQGTRDFVQDGVEYTIRLILGQISFFRDRSGKFRFTHKESLFDIFCFCLPYRSSRTAPKAPQQLCSAADFRRMAR